MQTREQIFSDKKGDVEQSPEPIYNYCTLSKGCPSLPILHFFYIVQNAFDPPPLPFEHLVEKFRSLRGHLLGYYKFCSSFFNMGLTPPPPF